MLMLWQMMEMMTWSRIIWSKWSTIIVATWCYDQWRGVVQIMMNTRWYFKGMDEEASYGAWNGHKMCAICREITMLHVDTIVIYRNSTWHTDTRTHTHTRTHAYTQARILTHRLWCPLPQLLTSHVLSAAYYTYTWTHTHTRTHTHTHTVRGASGVLGRHNNQLDWLQTAKSWPNITI